MASTGLRRRFSNPSRFDTSSPSPISRGGATATRSTTLFFGIPIEPNFVCSSSIFGAVNAVGFVISCTTGSHLHLDLLGTGAFIPATLIPLLSAMKRVPSLPASAIASQLTVALWAGRLASFLFYRATILKHDARLAETLGSISGCFGFWFLSFLWGVLASLPHTLSLSPIAKAKSFRSQPAPFVLLSAAGFLLSIAGIAIEVIADFQKWNFKKNNPSNHFISQGLWGVSQHPNYFGNLLVFFGLFLQNFGVLKSSGSARALCSLLSPVFLFGLFYAQSVGLGGGALAVAKEAAIAKYGTAYKEYMETTPLIFPKMV